MAEESNEEKVGVVYVGTMDDCKYALSLLERRGYAGVLDVAARLGPQFEVKGYYVVTVPEEEHEDARLAMEEELRKDLEVEDAVAAGEENTCPACGHSVSDENDECPECGISFV